ncbi:MAG TPA: single-stranded DNA-binding protein [Bacillota bacterium]|nr:single-stranded DNA-binding protein [Bacillota bacterium]HPJ23406.1 single-stranded DNA-binding protein [Bacillota bacterium]
MYNKVVLIGRLTKDPELRYTSTNNLPVVSFTLAVNRPYSVQGNDRNADFINCTAWRKQAENIHRYVSKGSLVAVEGKLQTRDYLDEKINARRYITEVVCDSVVFLDTKNQSDNNDPSVDDSTEDELPKGNFDNVEDDLPF